MLSETYTEDRAGIIRYWIDDPFYPSPAIVGFIREHGCRIWDFETERPANPRLVLLKPPAC